MTSVDSRIVTMKFDNAEFERKAATSLSTLGKIKASMNFGSVTAGATKGLGAVSSILGRFSKLNPFKPAQAGLTDLQTNANRFELTGLQGGITGVSGAFVAMSTVAITALSNIVNKAVDAGLNITKALTIDPVKAGLSEYETNLNSIQTILANTQVAGTGLPEVNAALEELNHYSDKTIYNFGEMARNIGTFTAAGVDLDTSVSSIKGIANLAALSGSNSQQASTAMYQLSQEIAAGRVSLMGWNSVVNAGMGGSTFQRALVTTAQEMGSLNGKTVEFQGSMKNAVIDGQSFRDSIMAKPGEQSWLTKEVLTGTLKQFTGDMTDAELAAEGFDKAQIKSIQQMAKTAEDAATKVKTLSGVFDTAKEVVGSGWSKTFQLIFGDFEQARTLFTSVSNTVNGVLGGIADARNEVLSEWSLNGGRDAMIKALGNVFQALGKIVGAVKDAMADIFPPTTGDQLIDMTEGFLKLTRQMMPSKDTLEAVGDIARGVFSVFSIAGKILAGVVAGFKAMFDTVGGGNGNFLDFGASIGNALTALNQFLEDSGVITTVFETIGNVLAVPLALITGLASALGSLFDGFNVDNANLAGEAIQGVSERLSGLQSLGNALQGFFSRVGDIVGSIASTIADALGGVGDAIASAFDENTFSATLDVINTSLLGAIVLMIKQFFGQGVSIDLTGGLFDGIKETLGSATGALENLQSSLKADILLKIGIAIGVLAASLLVLSTIDPSALRTALAAMAAGFGVLIVAMGAMMKILGTVGLFQIYAISSAMTKLALSMLILSFALKVMASIKFGDMIRGLGGMAGALLIMTKALIPLAKGSKGMAKASASLILVGIALNVIAVALKIFASMSWEEMARGLAGVAGTLVVLAAAMKLMPKDMVRQAAAIFILGGALNVLGVAVRVFASMDYSQMVRGLVGVAGTLVAIGLAMRAMPKGMLFQAVALGLISGALVVLSGALKVMSSMSWEEIAKGLATLAGAMLILAVGLNAMKLGVLGAAAMVVVAGALSILVPQLIVLGSLSWETIIKGLTALAGIFVILGVAAYAMSGVTLVLIGLAASVLLVGVGIALLGAGVLAMATAFGILVASGTAGIQLMGEFFRQIISAIPPLLASIGKGIVQLAQKIGQGAPKIAAAFGKILVNMLNAVIKTAPKIGQAFTVLLNTVLKVLVNAIPRIADAGLRIILGLLRAIESHVGDIVDVATSIIVKFLAALGRNIPKLTDAGAKLVIALVNGTAKAIRENSDDLGRAGADLGFAIIEGMASAIASGGGVIKDKLTGIARDALGAAKDFLGVGGPSKTAAKEIGRPIPLGVAKGIDDSSSLVTDGLTRMSRDALSTLKTTMSGLSNELTMDPDFNPRVTPVLDLSQMSRDASQISSLISTNPISPSVSYSVASDIAVGKEEASANEAGENGGGDTNITYEQHLHSPKPLDRVGIYRETKSLISLKTGELTS